MSMELAVAALANTAPPRPGINGTFDRVRSLPARRLAYCARADGPSPLPEGTQLSIALTVGATGTVTAADIRGQVPAELVACMKQGMYRWQLPAPARPFDLELPLRWFPNR
jgi:hypothetical protein